MSPLLMRLLFLAAVSIAAVLAVLLTRVVVARQQRLALAAHPLVPTADGASIVRILAFSTPDCTPCHTMQTPALHRVLAARGEVVLVEEIDALATPDLAQRYHVLTVPTTVVLDASGKARAVNYGFANAQRLLAQIDAILGEAN